MNKLRQWQLEAIHKAITWLTKTKKDRHFLINAAPGSGKTICACTIADTLLQAGEIDRVIVIAPRVQVVNQWAEDFRQITGRHMTKVTGGVGELDTVSKDICATWSALQGLQAEIQIVCKASRVLVICDEHHHAAVEAAWGDSADSAMQDARYVLVLTGTPIRSDGAEAVWLAYDDRGAIRHPEEGTYTLTYGQAVELGYCRPATFHRHEGKFSVELDNDVIKVEGDNNISLPDTLRRIPQLQRSLNFYRLAKTPQYEKDLTTPSLQGYQASMLSSAIEKLDSLRYEMPTAGGLVIAPNIEMAEFMAKLIELLDGEKPIVVHSDMTDPGQKINAFRNSDRRWLVSVAMVSEGVDIRRLRVLVYLPNALTELAFRQAVGRVIRTSGYDDISRAYIVIPALKLFEDFARRVEEEMPQSVRQVQESRQKVCPACGERNDLSARSCACGHEFPMPKNKLKTCQECGTLNASHATSCDHCGASFESLFRISLDEALRNGAIARGLDLDEEEVREAERNAAYVKNLALKSGDDKIIKLIRLLPEESWSRLRSILDTSSRSNVGIL